MRQLIVGAKGQVGSALYEVLAAHYPVVGIDMDNTLDALNSRGELAAVAFDVLHICIPYNEKFEAAVMDYCADFLAAGGLTIIHSTTAVGVSHKLAAVHSPIRGVHPKLADGIRTFEKFFGGPRAEEAAAIFRELGIVCVCTDKADNTEALKLWDTTYYGWNIIFEKAVKAYCDENELDFDIVYKQANETYNSGFTALGKQNVVRPVMKDFPGKIGGHCVISNAQILGGEFADLICRKNKEY
jgi:hypothetical protein